MKDAAAIGTKLVAEWDEPRSPVERRRLTAAGIQSEFQVNALGIDKGLRWTATVSEDSFYQESNHRWKRAIKLDGASGSNGELDGSLPIVLRILSCRSAHSLMSS